MKSIKFAFVLVGMLLLQSTSLHAQSWNSNAGGWNTGYGTVYGSFGYAMATQNIYQTTQMQIRRLQQRQMMINQFGRAAVEKAEREAKAGRASSTSPTTTSDASRPAVTAPPVPKNFGKFRPDATVDTARSFADALGETPDEKKLVRTIFTTTKEAYEKQTASKGWSNNIAGGLTFFTVAAMTVYRDAEEPSDEALDMYYQAVNLAIDETPDFATIPNKDKQQFNNIMVGFAGLLLAGYTDGKQTQDSNTVKVYGQLAGELIKMVYKMDPERLKVKNGAIVIE